MEFLRFGSQIPGNEIGCCAMDIIQGFDNDPDDKYCIQLVSGDGGSPITQNGKQLFAGPTYKDIFLTRLRTGTFDNRGMPNHGFLAILTEVQLSGKSGPKWLALLKEQGFEFVRAVDNSVYYGTVRRNYVFALFRNAKPRGGFDPTQPPALWTELPENTKTQQEVFAALPPAKFLTEEECHATGAPVYESGVKGKYLVRKNPKAVKAPAKAAPWAEVAV